MIRYLALVFLIRFGFGTPYRDSEGLVVDGTRHGVYNLKVELDGKEDGLYYGKNEEKYRGKEVNSHGEYNGQSDGKSHGEYGGQSNGNKGYNGRSDGKDHGGHNRRKDREGDNKKMVYQQFYQFDQSPFKDMKEYEMCDGSYKEEYRQVYCKGPLLEAVNHLRIYNDSKDYVDSVLKQAPAIIIAEFQKRFGDEPDVSQIDRSDLQKFIDEFFSPPESELDNCEPEDWTERPTNILKIQDANLRDWALNLNGLWKTLCRRVKTTVFADKERHSLIPVNQPFIVPGGRFREFYYWDTYWIIKGLLVSGMQTSSRYMLKNMLQMVEQFGFVPNGGRAYYTRRSHPPTLIPAVYEYYQASGDRSFVNSSLSLLEKEFNFWAEQRSKAFQIDGDTVRAYFYESPTNVPRPESFLADYEVAINMKEEDRPFFFKAAASAAESGWDFSSRWFRDDQTLQSMETQNIAPVDLNAFLCYNMDILGYLFEVTGYSGKADEYQRKFDRFRKTFEKIFYNETEGAWYDYNIRTEAHNLRVYPSIAVPLFTGCYNRLDESKKCQAFLINLGKANS
ncbi:unnamed protein product [Bursaphelenchus okinawaensis]|uniref:Trehalase n=1 Tax=Bursaphelenchus okinawaensis TaxID=465554 RepID=A0A811LDY9_9BILA|nr:unnamed protein product [Bursaphelenchus okinawaensis]CAG9121454.1 unnamed protein product [Bursaphelenchus okinawaensis]